MGTKNGTGSSTDDKSAQDTELAKLLGLGQDGEKPDDDEEPHEGDESEEGEDDEDGDEPAPKFEDLHPETQAEIKALRKESGDRRGKIRSLEKELRDARAGKTQTPEEEVAAAEARGEARAREQYGIKLAGAEVKATLKGVIPDEKLDAVVSMLDLARFVDEEGEVDTDEVASLREEYISLLGVRKAPARRSSHGRQGGGSSKKKSTSELFGEALGIG